MKKLNRIFVIGLALILTAMPILAAAKSFSDVTDHWSKPYVEYVADKGWVYGYPDGTFGPEGNITNAEFAALINRVAKLEGNAVLNYTDIPEKEWYRSAVETGVAVGYLSNQGEFKPNEPISREEVARIIGFIYSLKGNDSSLDAFTDAIDITPANRLFIAALVELNIIEGYPEGNFLPKNFIKRGEMAVILYKMFEHHATIFDKDEVGKPNNPVEPELPVAGDNWYWGHPILPILPELPKPQPPEKPDPEQPEEPKDPTGVSKIDWYYTTDDPLDYAPLGTIKLEASMIDNPEKVKFYTVTFKTGIEEPDDLMTTELTEIGQSPVNNLPELETVTVTLFDKDKNQIGNPFENVPVNKIYK